MLCGQYNLLHFTPMKVDTNVMNYIPQWERLSQVVARIVAATGVSEQQAQADIVTEGAIRYRDVGQRNKARSP
jgi:hypothetical protein